MGDQKQSEHLLLGEALPVRPWPGRVVETNENIQKLVSKHNLRGSVDEIVVLRNQIDDLCDKQDALERMLAPPPEYDGPVATTLWRNEHARLKEQLFHEHGFASRSLDELLKPKPVEQKSGVRASLRKTESGECIQLTVDKASAPPKVLAAFDRLYELLRAHEDFESEDV